MENKPLWNVLIVISLLLMFSFYLIIENNNRLVKLEIESEKNKHSPTITITTEDRESSLKPEDFSIGFSCDFEATGENLIRFKENNPDLIEYIQNQPGDKFITFDCNTTNLEGIKFASQGLGEKNG